MQNANLCRVFLLLCTLVPQFASAAKTDELWSQLQNLGDQHLCSLRLKAETRRQILNQNFEFGKLAFETLGQGLLPLKSDPASGTHVFNVSMIDPIYQKKITNTSFEVFSDESSISFNALGFTWTFHKDGAVIARSLSPADTSPFIQDFFSISENSFLVNFESTDWVLESPYFAKFEFDPSGALKRVLFSTNSRSVEISDIKKPE